MSNPFVPRIGGVLSADIAVPDHDSEVRFYSRVLTTGETPLWREDLMNNRGMPVIGLGPRSEEYADLPLQWMPHIQVADVGASVQRALERGGKELLHARGDDGASQWAVLLDPIGAAFGLIPVVPDEALAAAAGVAAPVGHICGLELTVADAGAARDFYRAVVGWSVEAVDMDDAAGRYRDYSLRGEGGDPVASIRHARGDRATLPATWTIHLPVGDLPESLRHVRAHGGEVVHETAGEVGGNAGAVVQDPLGVTFALVSA